MSVVKKTSSLPEVGANDIRSVLPWADTWSLEWNMDAQVPSFVSLTWLTFYIQRNSVKIQICQIGGNQSPRHPVILPRCRQSLFTWATAFQGIPKEKSLHQPVTAVCEFTNCVSHGQGDKTSIENSCSRCSTWRVVCYLVLRYWRNREWAWLCSHFVITRTHTHTHRQINLQNAAQDSVCKKTVNEMKNL